MYLFSSKIKENPCSPFTIELKSHLTAEYGIFIYVFKNISFMNSSMKKFYYFRNKKSQLNTMFYLLTVSNAARVGSWFFATCQMIGKC